jgi:hypothetical protein
VFGTGTKSGAPFKREMSKTNALKQTFTVIPETDQGALSRPPIEVTLNWKLGYYDLLKSKPESKYIEYPTPKN